MPATKTETRAPLVSPRNETTRRATPTPTRRPALVVPPVPAMPSRSHALLPKTIRNGLAAAGWWQAPASQRPSVHLLHTLATLEHYGWTRSLDFSPTGRMCIRGAQTLLETTGHVTPAAREQAVHHMQNTLAGYGEHTPFHAWNDYPHRTFPQVKALLTMSAHAAHRIGD